MRTKVMSLRQLINEIDDYDEYRPIFFRPARRICPNTRCLVVLGDDPRQTDVSAVPLAARLRGMARFLSSGQIMDVEGTLSALRGTYSEDELYIAIADFYKVYVKP